MYKIRAEWTLREMERDPSLVTRRALLTWLSIALGLKNPRDGREGVVYVLDALFHHCFRGKEPTLEEIKDFVNKRLLERGKKSLSDETLRHHLRKMMRMGIVERFSGKYCFSRNPLRPDDPTGFIDVMFSRLISTKELLKSAVLDLKSLYS